MDSLDRLRDYLVEVPARLTALSEYELTQHAPGKWSRKQILGHLIDSALNNLKRFTDAQFADGPYLVQSYNQDQLVVVNQYQNLPLSHLLTLWASLNTQILAVVEAMPAEILDSQIQIKQSSDFIEQKSVAWLIEDYSIHLRHHLKNLL